MSTAVGQRYKLAVPTAAVLAAAGMSAAFAASASTPSKPQHAEAAAQPPVQIAPATPVVERSLPGDVSRSMPRPRTSPTSSKPRPKTPAATPAARKSAPAHAAAARPAIGAGWVCPIAGCAGRFTSGFGARVSPGGIGSTYHQGDDFAAAMGTGLRAMHHGTVTAAGWAGGLGLRVEVDFGGGVSAVYGHLSSLYVSTGQTVSAGQVIAASGNTGNSTGPHLHLEIHIGGTPIDPAPWLRAHGIF